MSLEIKGFVPLSTIDWEGKLAALLLVGGCNLRCLYCQNPDLVLNPQKIPTLPEGEILKELENRRKWLDGVVIGGGEPTMDPISLKQLLGQIKALLGYWIRLDTNGTQPEVIRQLIWRKEPLVDLVAMDIKTSLGKYPFVVNTPQMSKIEKNIDKSIDYILESGVEYEFRTTVVPKYAGEEEIKEIAKYLARKGARGYVLQQFNPKITLDPQASVIEPYSEEVLEALAQECGRFLPTRLRFLS